MQDWFYYKYLDLPQVPDHIVKSALEFAHDPERCVPEKSLRYSEKHVTPNTNIVRTYWFRPLKVYGEDYRANSPIRFEFEDFYKWVEENITDDFLDASMCSNLSIKDGSTIVGMHTDTSRHYLLMYLLETSNVDQKTVWWQERDHEIFRESDLQINYFDDTLTPIHETVYEKGKWVLMNSKILHSVHNIKGHRIALHVSLNDVQVAKVMK